MNIAVEQGTLDRAETYRARIETLREVMRNEHVDACVVPSSDPHLSEYPPLRWQGRAWLSGFTGSVGTLVVTASFAGLWVDSRYWVQAEAELAGTGIALMKLIGGRTNAHLEWVAEHLPAGATLAIDGNVLALGTAALLKSTLENGPSAGNITLRTDLDLVDRVWTDRPALPLQPIFAHEPPFAPVARGEKLAMVRHAMAALGADWHLVSTLDDLAWIFNLRGADVSYNPVFVAHALIGPSGVTLFIDSRKVPEALAARLKEDAIHLAPYESVQAALRSLPAGAKLLMDPRRTTLGLAQIVDAAASGVTIVEQANPSTLAKAMKRDDEALHIRDTMAQDGAALCEFFSWLEGRLAVSDPELSELSVDTALRAARSRRPGFVCESFATIAGFNANGALPHYRATPQAFSQIVGDGLLLIDSGGQYLGGTTDITRVVPVGEPSDAQKQDFTTVLKGTIALSRARFPKGIRSPMLDAIARAPIWAEGLDFGHGTGHGVGYFLNVHEGPQVISHYANAEPSTAMEPGMITSIEPGVYRPGKWGIRIENLVINRPVKEASEFGEFLEFETLTMCPIDTRCIVVARLSAGEREWLNAYHASVRARLSPLLQDASSASALDWLIRRTEPI